MQRRNLKWRDPAEGVETDQQARYFSSAKLPIYGQGLLYGRPVTAAEFHLMLANEGEKVLVPGDLAATWMASGALQVVHPGVA